MNDLYNYNKLLISKANLLYNLDTLLLIVKDISKISPVLKADAYGIGLVEFAEILDEYGIKRFCVAKVIEAFRLRENGFNQEILILGHNEEENYKYCVENNVTITIHDEYSLNSLIDMSKKHGWTPKIHIKYNTGMNRIGFSDKNRVIEIIKKNSKEKILNIEGIFSHLSKVYDGDVDFTLSQINKFDDLILELEAINLRPKIVHLLSSGGIILHNSHVYDMCRPGCLLYGLLPDRDYFKDYKFKEIINLKSKIIQIHHLEKFESVGYSGGFITNRDSKIAILPLGYADGLPRRLSNKGRVIIKGKYYPIVGNISMDMCAVDITGSENIDVGDEVIIIGKQGLSSINVISISEALDTVRTEIMINISDRVEKVLVDKFD